jgi:hypothetical protein
MIQAQSEREARMQTVTRLQSDGYRLAEVGHRLPDGLVADLYAVRGDEVLVVEVRRRDQVNDVLPIAKYVESQPGWRFELVTFEPPEPVPTADWVHTLAHSASIVLETVNATSAAILAWVAVESGLRLLADRSGISTRVSSVGALISEMYSEEVIGDDRFAMLRTALDLRNQIVHGLPRRVEREEAAELIEYADALGSGAYPLVRHMVGWYLDHYEPPERSLSRDSEESDWAWMGLGPHHAEDVLANEYPEALQMEIDDASNVLNGMSEVWVRLP